MDKKSIKNNNDYNPVHKHKATQSTLQLKLDEFLSRNFADDRTFVVLRAKKQFGSQTSLKNSNDRVLSKLNCISPNVFFCLKLISFLTKALPYYLLKLSIIAAGQNASNMHKSTYRYIL